MSVVAARGRRAGRSALVWLALGAVGCVGQRVVRLENDLLRAEVVELRSKAGSGRAEVLPSVTPELLVAYLERAGLPAPERSPSGVLVVPCEGVNTRFRLSLQHFEREQVLYLAAVDYMDLEVASSSGAMVLLLTQLAAINYELVLGKFQLNPRSGAITLSVELKTDDGLGFRSFDAAVHQLLETADERYPDLLRAARGQGI